MTDQGMDLTSLASDTRRYSVGAEKPSIRHTAVQSLIMNLNAQEQPHPASGAPASNQSHDMYSGVALELKNKPTVINLSTGKPHVMMVQLDESNTSQGGTVSQLVKKEEPAPPPQVLDLTGQIKPESQAACCDVVYKLPFAGSCTGALTQRPTTAISDKTPTTQSSQVARPPPAPHYSQQQQQKSPAMQGLTEEHKLYQPQPPGGLQTSVFDTIPSMTDVGPQHYQRNDQGAVDLSTMNQPYDAYLGMGAQYGSYTDLRQVDVAGPPLPLRRYGSMSNINSDYGYGPRELAAVTDANLAQYSATTAREISRMCAALNSMDQYGSRFANPELMHYGGRGGPTSKYSGFIPCSYERNRWNDIFNHKYTNSFYLANNYPAFLCPAFHAKRCIQTLPYWCDCITASEATSSILSPPIDTQKDKEEERLTQQQEQMLQLERERDGQVVQAVMAGRPIHSSSSEVSLRNSDDQASSRIMKKQNSMPRLRDGSEEDSVKRIADSCVQTDDEDGEDRFMNRRRRTRRIADCSVQTDEEDQGEWDQQPVRRRRSRTSKHSNDSNVEKSEAKVSSSSIAIQTTNDSSCQTETEQLGRVSPAIHITMAETSKVDLLHYIAAPERTQKGESLACQTEPEAQSQGVVAPQLSVPTTISPYSTSLHMVGATPSEPASPRLQGVAKFERRKPDPLEIGYQQQHESRQPPKSPQVLYSPVSPLSPHRMLETTFASQEKLNKAHVTPQQKAFTAESPPRHQTLPRPIKSMASLQQQNSLMRKVKRTLPSPPPEEIPLPIVTPAQMYSSPGMPQRVLPRAVQGVTKAGLLSELKMVEQESSKLRKQQAELEEEEKEIDAKLRYLELGITQRKETMVKDRERRELAYLRCMGDARDYMSDSELNNLRIAAATGTFDTNGVLSRPSTAPLSHFANDLNATPQYPSTSTYMSYPYPQTQPTSQPPGSAYQQIGFQPPQYPSSSAPQPGTFQPHPPPGPAYQTPGSYSSHMYGQSTYQTDLGMPQHGHQGFQPPGQPMPGQSLPYPSHSSYQPGLPFQPQAEILTVHQRPRQTSLADLEQKLPTNYEVSATQQCQWLPQVQKLASAQSTVTPMGSTAPPSLVLLILWIVPPLHITLMDCTPLT
ncbi:hypothetical protein CRUP_021488 [Coryphaenoides rupestris]|nr:hypothetical protein CRUP_021488 [Coryphaenoides rupestris]